MTDEQAFIDAINANAGEDPRLAEHVYADWLDEQGDPRAEAWRVLIEAGKRPDYDPDFCVWNWWVESVLENILPKESQLDLDSDAGDWFWETHKTFHAAMNAAAIAWVRGHRDPDFLKETEEVG